MPKRVKVLLVRVCIVCSILLLVYTLKPLVVAADTPPGTEILMTGKCFGGPTPTYSPVGIPGRWVTIRVDGAGFQAPIFPGPNCPQTGCANVRQCWFGGGGGGIYYFPTPLVAGASEVILTAHGLVYREQYTAHDVKLDFRVIIGGVEQWAPSPTPLSLPGGSISWLHASAHYHLPALATLVGVRVLGDQVNTMLGMDHLEVFASGGLGVMYPGLDIRAVGTTRPTSWFQRMLTGKSNQARVEVTSYPTGTDEFAESFHVIPLLPEGVGDDFMAGMQSYDQPLQDQRWYEWAWVSWCYETGTQWTIRVTLPSLANRREEVELTGSWNQTVLYVRAPGEGWSPGPGSQTSVTVTDPASTTRSFWQLLFEPSSMSLASWRVMMDDLTEKVPVSLFHDVSIALTAMYANLPSGADWEFDLSSGPAFPLVVTLEYDSSVAVVIRAISTALIIGSFLAFCLGIYSRFFVETKK
jgi:hypothetical protein